MKRTMMLSVAALSMFLGCKPPMLDTKKAEATLQTELKAKGVTLTTVTCPSGIQLKTGTTFQCTAQDDQGTTGVFDMTVKDNTGDVAWQLEGKYMDMKVLGDNLEAKISKASNNQPVDVTCPSKNILVAKGTAFTCDVMVGTSAAKIAFTCTSNDGTLDYKITDLGTLGGAAAMTYRWENNPKTNMKFQVPSAWNKQVNGEVMVITTPTPGAGLELVAATGGLESHADEKSMLAAVGKTLQNAKLTSALKPAQQHGLKGFVATGTGQKNGGQVQWFTAALGDGKGHALLALGFYGPSTSTDYKTELSHVLDSIQPSS